MAATRMIFSDARARAEIGYSSRPAVAAITRSARWYADNGFVSNRRMARIRWSEAAGTRRNGLAWQRPAVADTD
jgi:hypothetical protein